MLGTRAPAIAGDALLSPNRVVVSPHRSVDDFCLGFFDETCLREYPPESDWSDWFPPPPRLTDWELCDLADWAEIEAAKHNLFPDPETYPLAGYFDPKENNGTPIDPYPHPCAACPFVGTSSRVHQQPRCPLSCPLVGTLRG